VIRKRQRFHRSDPEVHRYAAPLRLARGSPDHFPGGIDAVRRAARTDPGLGRQCERARAATDIEHGLARSQFREIGEPLVQIAATSERQQARHEVVVARMGMQNESLRGGCRIGHGLVAVRSPLPRWCANVIWIGRRGKDSGGRIVRFRTRSRTVYGTFGPTIRPERADSDE